MKTYELKAQVREDLGKRANKALRKQELIPAVIYGPEKNTNLTLNVIDVRNMIYTPDIYIIDLNIDGEVRKCIIQELQFHPVTDNVLHIDFLEVFDDKPIVIEVPVSLDGLAAGVRAGGKLSMEMRKLKVKALYKDIPDRLHIDVTKLKLGKTIQVGELSFENIELLNAKKAVVAAVRLTRAARASAAQAALAGNNDDEEEEE